MKYANKYKQIFNNNSIHTYIKLYIYSHWFLLLSSYVAFSRLSSYRSSKAIRIHLLHGQGSHLSISFSSDECDNCINISLKLQICMLYLYVCSY